MDRNRIKQKIRKGIVFALAGIMLAAGLPFAAPAKRAEADENNVAFSADAFGNSLEGTVGLGKGGIYTGGARIEDNLLVLESWEYSNPSATFSYRTKAATFSLAAKNPIPTRGNDSSSYYNALYVGTGNYMRFDFVDNVSKFSSKEYNEKTGRTEVHNYYKFNLQTLLNWAISKGVNKNDFTGSDGLILIMNPIYQTRERANSSLEWTNRSDEHTNLSSLLNVTYNGGKVNWSESMKATVRDAYQLPISINLKKGSYEVKAVFDDKPETTTLETGTFFFGEKFMTNYDKYSGDYEGSYSKVGMAITTNDTRPSNYTSDPQAYFECSSANLGDSTRLVLWIKYEKKKTVPKKYKLSITADDGGDVDGTVVGSFEAGTTIMAQAIPDTGKSYSFKSWAGVTGLKKPDGTDVDKTNSALVFKMPSNDVTIIARFRLVPDPPAAPTINPTLTIDTSDEGIESATGDGIYAEGTYVSISCTLKSGYTFAGWSCGDSSVVFQNSDSASGAKVKMPAYSIEVKPKTVKNATPVTSISEGGYDRYYSTSAGYSVGSLVSGVELCGYSDYNTYGYSNLFKNNNSYSVGKDSRGNEWYFIPSGSTATWVHPKTYNGYDVNSSQISLITEMTFPDKIGGYTVTSIGGALAYYGSGTHANTSNAYTSEYWTTDKVTGSHSYQSGTSSNMSSYGMSYTLGVVGNGAVYSSGYVSQMWPNGSYRYVSVQSHYTVYNTTLKSITIPATVTRIENYAFYNCNAIAAINGATGLKEIGVRAFSSSSVTLEYSSTGPGPLTGQTMTLHKLYDMSEAFEAPETSVMQTFYKNHLLNDKMDLPGMNSLLKIEQYAFNNRRNLVDVVLPASITTVELCAFNNCRLTSITIPNASVAINSNVQTLGGKRGDRTRVIAVTGSNGFSYAQTYYTHYVPDSSVNVIYMKNLPGAAPESQTETAVYEEDFSITNSLLPSGGGGGNNNSYTFTWSESFEYEDSSYSSSGKNDTNMIVSLYNGSILISIASKAADDSFNCTISGRTITLNNPSGVQFVGIQSCSEGLSTITNKYGTVKCYGTRDRRSTSSSSSSVSLQMALPVIKAIASDGRVWTGALTTSHLSASASSGYYSPSEALYQTLRNAGADTIMKMYYTWTSTSETAATDSYFSKRLDFKGVITHSVSTASYGSYVGSVTDRVDIVKTATSHYAQLRIDIDYGATVKPSTVRSYNRTYTLPLDVDIEMAFVIPAGGTFYWSEHAGDSGWSDAAYGEYNGIDGLYMIDQNDCLWRGSTKIATLSGKPVCASYFYVYGNYHLIMLCEDGTVYLVMGPAANPLKLAENVDSFSIKSTYPINSNGYYSQSNVPHTYLKIGNTYYGGPNYLYPYQNHTSYNYAAHATDSTITDGVFYAGTVYPEKTLIGYHYAATVYNMPTSWSNGAAAVGYEWRKYWTALGSDTGGRFVPGDRLRLKESITLFAQWEKLGKKIIYHPNGANGSLTTETYDLSTATATLKSAADLMFTRPGYTFSGWATSKTGAKAYNAAQSVTLPNTLDLYAVWTADSYTVSVYKASKRLGALSNSKTLVGTYAQNASVPIPALSGSSSITLTFNANKKSGMSETPAVSGSASVTLSVGYTDWNAQAETGGVPKSYLGNYAPGITVDGLCGSVAKGSTICLYPDGINAPKATLSLATCYGYAFTGWSKKADGSAGIFGRSGGSYSPAETETLYAQFSPKKYAIAIRDVHSTALKENTYASELVTMTFDAALPGVFAPDPEVGMFMGLYTGKDGTGLRVYDGDGVPTGALGSTFTRASITTLTNNGAWNASTETGTLYAYYVFEYDVTFNANGGSTPKDSGGNTVGTVTIKYGDTYGSAFTGGVMPVSAKTGYSCGTSPSYAWYTAASGGDAVASTAAMTRTEDHTLYMHWTPITYYVRFNSMNGTEGSTAVTGSMTNQTFTYDTAQNLSACGFSKSGYSFGGWSTTSARALANTKDYNGGQSVNNLSSTAGAVVDIYAVWTPNTYTVTFNANDSAGTTRATLSTTSKTTTFDAKYGDLPAPTRTGYAFAGWYTAASGGTLITKDTSMTTAGNHTLYAHWTANTYTVTFNKNDSAGSTRASLSTTSVTVTFDAAGTAPVPTRVGYIFNGWFDAASGGNKVYTDAGAPVNDTGYWKNGLWNRTAGNVTVYAHWTPVKYKIRFNACGTTGSTTPSGTMALQEHTYDEAKTLSIGAFSREGYIFRGWETTSAGANVFPYTITYLDGQQVLNLSAENGAVIDLYAVWDPIRYNIKFDKNDNVGTTRVENTDAMPDQMNVPFDASIWNAPVKTIKPNAYIKYGYNFTGWALTASGSVSYANGAALGTKRADNLTATNGATVTLYAKWEAKKTTVTLDGRGALEHTQTSVELTFDKPCPAVTIPKKRGYTFDGYFLKTKAEGDSAQYYTGSGTSATNWVTDFDIDGTAKVLYAHWTQNPVELPEEGTRTDPDKEDEESKWYNAAKGDATVLIYADDGDASTGAETDRQAYIAYDVMTGGRRDSEGAMPSTEDAAIRAKARTWFLDFTMKKITGKDTVRVEVTIPYKTQHEKTDETLVISGRQEKTYTFNVPRAWAYWSISEGGIYYLDKLKVENGALAGGSATIPVDWGTAGGATKPAYTIRQYTEAQHRVWNAVSGVSGHSAYPCCNDEIAAAAGTNYKYTTGHDASGDFIKITVTEEQYLISTTVGSLPSLDATIKVLAENIAWEDSQMREDTQYRAKNDFLSVAGKTLLSDTVSTTGSTQGLDEAAFESVKDKIVSTVYAQIYKSGIGLNPAAPNGRYETAATFTYVADAANPGPKTDRTLTMSSEGLSESPRPINAVNILTPVACDGRITVGGTEYGHYGTPEKDAVIALNGDFNYFTVELANEGTHKLLLGYGTGGFGYSRKGTSNVAKNAAGSRLNRVKFPFDVYMDIGNDSYDAATGKVRTAGDRFIPKNNWIIIDGPTGFYIPVTQQTGTYDVEFLTVAVNAPGIPNSISGGAADRGTNSVRLPAESPYSYRHAAYDTVRVDIRGSFTDVIIRDTNDPSAKDEYRAGRIAPLGRGYSFSFLIRTTGTDLASGNAELTLTPEYYYAYPDGRGRLGANVYYFDTVNGKKRLIRAGSTEDAANMHRYSNMDAAISIPDSLLRRTAGILGDSLFRGAVSNLFTYSQIRIGKYLKVFPSADGSLARYYCSNTTGGACNVVYEDGEARSCGHAAGGILPTGIMANAETARQEWYGTFGIPADTYVVSKDTMQGYCSSCGTMRYVTDGRNVCPEHGTALAGLRGFDLEEYLESGTFDGTEEFFRRDGYLVINVTVEASNGAEVRQPYIEWENTSARKMFLNSPVRYMDGDIAIYRIGRSIRDDYEIGGTE